VCPRSTRGALVEEAIERLDLLGVLEVLLMDDPAPADAREQHGAVLVHHGAVVGGLIGEQHRDAGVPRRAVDEDVVGRADEARVEEPVDEGLDRRLAPVLTGPRAVAREDQHGVVGITGEDRAGITGGQGSDVASDLPANRPLVHVVPGRRQAKRT
jgi:hypothetical protein